MNKLLSDIRTAIDKFDMELARNLLKGALEQNPTADVYYLASLAAVSHKQKILFLEKAVELDPFHKEAKKEIQKYKESSLAENQSQSSPPDQKKSVETLESKTNATNKLAIISFIIGAVGVILGALLNYVELGGLLWLASVITGIIAMKQIKIRGERGKGWVIVVFLMPVLLIVFIISLYLLSFIIQAVAQYK